MRLLILNGPWNMIPWLMNMIKESNSSKRRSNLLTKEFKRNKKKSKKSLLKLKSTNLMVKISKELMKKKLKILNKIVCLFCLRKIVKFKELQKRTNKIMKNSKKSKILTVRFHMSLTLQEIQSLNSIANWKTATKR